MTTWLGPMNLVVLATVYSTSLTAVPVPVDTTRTFCSGTTRTTFPRMGRTLTTSSAMTAPVTTTNRLTPRHVSVRDMTISSLCDGRTDPGPTTGESETRCKRDTTRTDRI